MDLTPGRLVIGANRLPVQRDAASGEWQTSPGGLVAALVPILQSHEGTWVGWSGAAEDDPGAVHVEGLTLQAIPLSESEVDGYYFGFCNRTIWPLYHDSIRAPEFHRHWWRPYWAVNRRFAEALVAEAEPNDAIWIHDYQLQLAPGMVRALAPETSIGFFLHIPFPPPEIFARLPWRKQMIDGLLGADHIGFQTEQDAENFARSAVEFADATGTAHRLEYQGRNVIAEALPISIDTPEYERMAKDPAIVERATTLRFELGEPDIVMFGLDRLDYSKGIDLRLRAFETLLERRPDLVKRVVLVQVALPSREDVEEYQITRRGVEELVGRINGEFGLPDWTPVRYLYRNLDWEEVLASFRAADVMLVTPLRDGMNLVAKEYVAMRNELSGVLVLSQFAGAAERMSEALLVNPYDVDGLAATLETAIQLDPGEAKRRMESMLEDLRKWDVHVWARHALNRLGL